MQTQQRPFFASPSFEKALERFSQVIAICALVATARAFSMGGRIGEWHRKTRLPRPTYPVPATPNFFAAHTTPPAQVDEWSFGTEPDGSIILTTEEEPAAEVDRSSMPDWLPSPDDASTTMECIRCHGTQCAEVNQKCVPALWRCYYCRKPSAQLEMVFRVRPTGTL